MKRRTFVKASVATIATAGTFWKLPDYTYPDGMNKSLDVHTLELSATLRVHAIMAGTVAVKRTHREYHGPEQLRFPVLMADWRWTEPLPIWTWLIEHPEGNFLVDTGENISVQQSDYLDSCGTAGRINRKILRLGIQKSQQVSEQLRTVGVAPEDVNAVVLTHLHLDHTDGLKFFPQSEVIVGESEWKHPYGSVPCTFPHWLKPHLVNYQSDDSALGASYRLAHDLWIVPTPGHSFGHQSVVLQHDGTFYFFAGDTSFSEQQLVSGKVAGICADLVQTRQTYERIKTFAGEVPLVYLPSHDPDSAQRLRHREVLPG